MSFFDTLKKNAGIAAQTAVSVADTAVKQTKTMASAGRVRLAIVSEEDKLKKAYTELGRLFYRDYAAQAEADMAEYLPWCQKAQDAREQIQKLTEELERLKQEAAAIKAEFAIVEGPEPVAEDSAEPAPEAEEPAEAPAEDMSIFADLEESATEETPAEEVPEAPVEKAPAEEAPAEEPVGTVGTLYIDVTEQE